MKRVLGPAAFSFALVASGCVSVLPKPSEPAPRYAIEAVDAAALTGEAVNWSLIIEDPRAARVYDTVKVAVAVGPGKVEYFSGAEWTDRAPRLFQIALIESFEDSGRIIAVGDRTSLPTGDIALQADIRKFEIDASGGGRNARVSVYARLGDGRAKIFAARAFDASAPASGSSSDALLAALDKASKDVIAEMVEWAFAEGQSARAGAGS